MAMPKTALEGIRVLDLGRYQAGPRIGLVLARLGAEVIKNVSAYGQYGPYRSTPSTISLLRRTSRSCTRVMRALMHMEDGQIIPQQGALPIKRGNELSGAIGVSGARSEEDEEIARAGLAAL